MKLVSLKRNIFLFSLIFMFSISIASESYPDIQIVQKTDKSLTLEYTMQNFDLNQVGDKTESFHIINVDFSEFSGKPGYPNLPSRTVIIGKPSGSNVRVNLISSETESFENIRIQPVPYFTRNKKGISEFSLSHNDSIYAKSSMYPHITVQSTDAGQFRDIEIAKIILQPVQYNPVTGSLIVHKRMRIRIDYDTPVSRNGQFRSRGKLDKLYDKLLVNSDQATGWQVTPPKRLRKAASLPGGDWYRIDVNEDGLYRINPGTLRDAGITTSGLNINTIKMYNTGGHSLSYNANAEWYNPEFTKEIPIHIVDQNQNALLDDNDYILFFGKHTSGWFYSASTKTFSHHTHPYANQNNYWLNISQGNGVRMEKTLTQEIPGANEVDYFLDRYHFEEDLYNLLASGPDWYGKRFYGLSDGYSKSFDLETNQVPGSIPVFRIQLKGGAGIHYGDNLPYRYYFDIALNGTNLFSNVSFTEENRALYTKTLNDPAIVKNGTNSLSINYSANTYESSNAYLDWFEIYYSRGLSVKDNYLMMFGRDLQQAARYRFIGFSAASDIYIFDVTNPVNPLILAENESTQDGQIIVDTEDSDGERRFLVTSLSSPSIKTVAALTKESTQNDLLNPNQQADYIIITHRTFVPYAEQLKNQRTELSTKVVSTDDIYFNFNSGVSDPTAIRNFIRYAYNNWQSPKPSYVLLFGDGHYDFRNITLTDTMRVPPFEIYDDHEIDSRTTDAFYVDKDYNSNSSFNSISPDLAIGRLPAESRLDAERMVKKILDYENNAVRDGWQTTITLVGDDEVTARSSSEWMHQNQAESFAQLSELRKFNINKVYLSTFPSVPGGFGRVKPAANEEVVSSINKGTLIVNYVGHGSPVQWAHEDVFNMNRDLSRISNERKLPFMIAATCDFGKFDDPHEPSFTETLLWRENSGVIGVLAASRLVYSGDNAAFNTRIYRNLFPGGRASVPLGQAWLESVYSSGLSSNVNDQKYHLFADPTMQLADPRGEAIFNSVQPDTLKALSEVNVEGQIFEDGQPKSSFDGGAVLIVNDARYDSVNTGSGYRLVTLPGPQIFRGEVSINSGSFEGTFIVPKSIRYKNRATGRITVYAWSDDYQQTALGYNSSLLFNGSTNLNDSDGPEIDIFFKDQENFTTGDMIAQNPMLIAEIEDASGINMTDQTGHNISLQVDDNSPQNVSGFFVYERDSHKKGMIKYPLNDLEPGEHQLRITAYDNLNNPSEQDITFKIVNSAELALEQVVNYPNPFKESTRFTFQTNRDGAEVKIKIYTISGRLIQELYGYAQSGYNQDIIWDGHDRDGDRVANGVYLYKIILDDGQQKREQIDKLVILK